MFSRIWRWLERIETAQSILSWRQTIVSTILGILAAVVAWFREQDPILIFVVGLGTVAALLVILPSVAIRTENRQTTEKSRGRWADWTVGAAVLLTLGVVFLLPNDDVEAPADETAISAVDTGGAIDLTVPATTDQALRGDLQERITELELLNATLESQLADSRRESSDWQVRAEEYRVNLGSRSPQRPIPPDYEDVSQQLMNFYRGYVNPANNDLGELVGVSTGDAEADSLRSQYLDLLTRGAEREFGAAYNRDRIEYGSYGELFQRFCRFIEAYREKKGWLDRLSADQVTSHERYLPWRTKDELLTRELIALAARDEFSGLRTCSE